jgi:hypothetical protein
MQCNEGEQQGTKLGEGRLRSKTSLHCERRQRRGCYRVLHKLLLATYPCARSGVFEVVDGGCQRLRKLDHGQTRSRRRSNHVPRVFETVL